MRSLAHRSADYAAYIALRVVVATLQALPMAVCERGASALAWLFDSVLRFRRGLVDENLRVACPEWPEPRRRRAARRVWRHLFLMVCEIAHAPRTLHRTTWRRYCRLRGERLVVSTLLREGPKVIISGHYGNFELGGYLLGLFGFPTHTIARTLDNAYVDDYVNEFRGRTGQHILPKDGSREEVDRVLRGGGVLTLLGDQHAGPKGCWVDFFGKPASTHKAVSLFTLSYNAPTLVMGVRRGDQPMHYTVFSTDAADPAAEGFQLGSAPLLTAWFTEGLERTILTDPEQYWWVHRRWKGEPPRRRPSKEAAEPRTAAAPLTAPTLDSAADAPPRRAAG